MSDTPKAKYSRAQTFATCILAMTLHATIAHADITLTTLVTFDGTNGYLPSGGLVEGRDGNFYGALSYGGWYDLGTVYRMSPNGSCVVLTTLDGSNGSHPSGRFIQANDGNFYGTTLQGGPEGSGSVFTMRPDGSITTLTSFEAYVTGWSPGGLILGRDGNLYGVTHSGGPHNYGTVFKVTPKGELTTLAAFNKSNGAYPSSELVQDKDGNLYGSTSQGTPGLNGSTYKLSPKGELTAPATIPANTAALNLLIRSTNGNIYGPITGPAFRLGANGVLTGAGWFLKARDGNLYGTTFAGDGSRFGFGTVFRLNHDGTTTTLVSFNQTNGANPLPDLVQGRNGNIYGITTTGGRFNQGTIFRLNLVNPPRPTATGSSVANVPVLLHAVSNKVDPRILEAMQAPIDFYGKVVDEKTNAVAAASVTFRWSDLTARGYEASSTTQSDSQGFFSLRGKEGASLTVSVGKDDYYGTHTSQQTFKYSKMEGSARYSPNPRSPSIFELRKKGIGQRLINTDFPVGMGQHVQLRGDGTPVEIDLLNGGQAQPGAGQLKLEFWRNMPDRKARVFDWSLKASVPGGGLLETQEEFAFQAPESGYLFPLVIDMPATNRNWKGEIRSKYYVQLPGGKYGRIDLYLLPYNGVIRLHSAINPSGSRNVEPAQ